MPPACTPLLFVKQYLALALNAAAYASGLFTIAFCAASLLAAHLLWGRRKSNAPAASRGQEDSLPAITILKPIKGLDREMYDNLSSFLSQDYPCFQVIFCLQSPDDPALAVLKKLREDFPRCDMEIVVSNHRIGLNPKVNNLSNAAGFIKHELMLISDSDVRARVDCLRKLVEPFRQDPGVGLVTCFYQSSSAHGLGASLEFLSINAQFLPQAVVAAMLGGMRFAMGAMMLVPRRLFEDTGGFQNLSQHLADDFCLGRSVQSRGYRIAIAEPVVASIPDAWSLAGHFSHLARWSRTIRVCQPGGYLASLALYGFPLLALRALLLGPSLPCALLAAFVVLARMASVAWIHLVYLRNTEILPKLPLLPLSDIIQFLAWLAGFGSRKVSWRGEQYHIQANGRLIAMDPVSSPRSAVPAYW